MQDNTFIGVWKLIKYEMRLADGISIHPFGEGVRGILIYEPDGHMALQIMEADRPRFTSNDWHRGTPDEVQTAFQGSMAYWGTFEVDTMRPLVIHHVEGCTYPNWVGVDREHFYEFASDRLSFMSPPMTLADEQVVSYLEWRRAR